MTASKCEQELSIPCYFFDINRNLRPASFFDIAQELAAVGAVMVGTPDSVLAGRDLVWILIRMHVHYDRLPQRGDTVRIQTWHSGVSGPLYTRDYMMLTPDGEPLVRSTSSWALMEISTRSLAKADRIFDLLPEEPQCAERAIEPNAPKIIWPRGKEPDFVIPHTVRYSDVDYNRHANNARYAVWAYDALPEEVTTGSQISDYYINFNRELHLGETTELSCVEAGEKSWIVEGVREGQQNFICRMDFR